MAEVYAPLERIASPVRNQSALAPRKDLKRKSQRPLDARKAVQAGLIPCLHGVGAACLDGDRRDGVSYSL
jgi:hypothetical protein